MLVTAQVAEDGSARVTQQMTVTNATPPERPEGPPERVGYETSWLKAAYILYVPDTAVNYSVSVPVGLRGAAVQEPSAARRGLGR